MKKTLIISFISMAIGLLLLSLVIYPLSKEIKKNSEDLISAKKTLISLQSKIENLEQFKSIYKTLDPSLEIMEDLFVDPEIPIDFIQFLEKIGADSNVTFDITAAPIKEKRADVWPSMDFQVSLTGPLVNCLKFFERIEAVPYLIEIQSFSAKRLSGAEIRLRQHEGLSEGNAVVNLSMKVFTK